MHCKSYEVVNWWWLRSWSLASTLVIILGRLRWNHRTHKFLPASPETLQFQADQVQLQQHLWLRLITCHLAFSSNDRFQPFWHASNFLVDKMLGNVGPSLVNQLFSDIIIRLRIFLRMLFDQLPAIFERREFGWWVTVEVEFQTICFVPFAYDVWFSGPYDPSHHFLLRQNRDVFESKALQSAEESGECKLFDPSSRWYFPAPNRIVYQTWNHSPTKPKSHGVHVLFFSFPVFLNTIRTVLFPELANNTQLAFQAITKMNLIIKSNAIPIFCLGISLLHHLCRCPSIASCLLIYSISLAGYTFLIMHRPNSSLDLFFILQSKLIPQLFLCYSVCCNALFLQSTFHFMQYLCTNNSKASPAFFFI